MATLGPSTHDEETIAHLLEAGMTVRNRTLQLYSNKPVIDFSAKYKIIRVGPDAWPDASLKLATTNQQPQHSRKVLQHDPTSDLLLTKAP